MGYIVRQRVAGKGARILKDTTAKHEAKPSDLNVGVFSQSPAAWPMRSYNLGINPDFIEDQVAVDEALGVKMEYCPKTGDAIIHDRAQRTEYCKAHGFYDRSGMYGDADRDQANSGSQDTAALVERAGVELSPADEPAETKIARFKAMQDKTAANQEEPYGGEC